MFVCTSCYRYEDEADAEGRYKFSTAYKWGYKESNGPMQWYKHVPMANGNKQSPVNILTRTVSQELTNSLNLHLQHTPTTYIMNKLGHTVTWTPRSGGSVTVERGESLHVFEFSQFHFHSPGEHKIDYKRFPLCLQFIHENNETGQLVILEHPFYIGKSKSEFLSRVMSEDEDVKVEPLELNGKYVHYKGSLTTPPCSENVLWFVSTQPKSLSLDQLRWFKTKVPYDNCRPVQPLNGRTLNAISSVVEGQETAA